MFSGNNTQNSAHVLDSFLFYISLCLKKDFTVELCPFSIYGCNFIGDSVILSKHLNSNLSEHFNLISKIINNKDKEIDSLKKENVNLRNKLKENLQNVSQSGDIFPPDLNNANLLERNAQSPFLNHMLSSSGLGKSFSFFFVITIKII
jgi:hypothetical protein